MEEVINKSDSQFKNILDDLVDYNKHASKKDPLIKELSRPNLPTPPKPAASLNSSTYSSAASSTSSNASDSSSSSSTASDSSSSSSSSSVSSTSSSPSQSQLEPANKNGKIIQDFGKLEMAEMEDLGKTAKILEHRRLMPSVLTSETSVTDFALEHLSLAVATSLITSTNNNNSTKSNSDSNNKQTSIDLSQTSAQKFAPASTTIIGGPLNGMPGVATTSGAGASNSSWKTISGRRDKKRKKPAEVKINAEQIPGHVGYRSVDELAEFIESGTNGTCSNSNNNKSTNTNSTNVKPKPKNISSSTVRQSQHQNQQQLSQPKQQQPKDHPIPPAPQQPHQYQRRVQPLKNPQQPHHQPQQQQQQQPQQQQRQQQQIQPIKQQIQAPCKSTPNQQNAAVTFAHHIKVLDDDVRQYTFGFFDDQQSNQKHQANKLTNANQNSSQPANNQSRKQVNHIQQSTQNEHKQKPKQSKASRISEENCFKSHDSVAASSFNHDQILKFISNCWHRAINSKKEEEKLLSNRKDIIPPATRQ